MLLITKHFIFCCMYRQIYCVSSILIGFTITCMLVLDHFSCDFCSDCPFFLYLKYIISLLGFFVILLCSSCVACLFFFLRWDFLFLVLTGWIHWFLWSNLLGAIEHKLFVASLNKQATPKEIEEASILHFLFSLTMYESIQCSVKTSQPWS